MKERYQKDETRIEYTNDTHPFGRTVEEMPKLRTKGERFSYWLKNTFWYHYKLYVFAGLALTILIGIFISDMLSNKKPDFQFVVASNAYLDETSLAEMTDLAQMLLGDSNGDGQAYIVGHPMYMGADGEMGMVMYTKIATLFVDEDIRFFIFDSGMLEAYFDEPEGFENLSERGYPVVSGKPWLVDLTGLPILNRSHIAGTAYYAAIQLPSKGDKHAETSTRLCLEFLDAMLTAP